MELFAAGCLKAILEKYAEPALKKVIEIHKDEWEKFKVDFDIAFLKYLKNSYEKYSKIKTILYRTSPQYIYDFFEVPFLEHRGSDRFKAVSVDDILETSNFIIIQGTGGIGKSTLMKHLFINELEQKSLIPVFLELKDINDLEKNYEINDIIYEKLQNLGSHLNKDYLEYALASGCFLFLFDGYDEILTDKKDYFFKRMDAFCDKYSENYYIISSRPYSEFIEFQRFTVLKTCSLSKEQAMSLVSKIEFDKDIRNRFIKALDTELYEKHKSFAANPLLLNIMLLTYDNYAEIPEKLHLFYENAFETLYSKHDATKAGYRRELRSGLAYDSFKKVFSYFCFMTYIEGKIEFSRSDLGVYFKKISINKITFEADDYIYDLINSLCVLYKDGLNYKFAHRSFQEYFTALFLKELPDESMKKMGRELIYRDIFRAGHDNVFHMLYDMAEAKFEQNILLPVLQEIEQETVGDKYDFYFVRSVGAIRFNKKREKNGMLLVLIKVGREDIIDFIYRCAYYYIEKGEGRSKRIQESSDNLLRYITDIMGRSAGESIEVEEIMEDEVLYDLVKKTWIGERVAIMANMQDMLEEKQEKAKTDLWSLLES
ncbi:MAG: NACHT domain-containing protein [Lachnospiraceae bacterium]|nr:NACHT domain-containing protein [Lachnospiraceae bacterium]